MAFEIARFLHITGVVMLMGNITVTAIWKFFADRDGRPAVLAFAQKLVTYTDWAMTLWGVLLTMGGGYWMAWLGGHDLASGWMLWSQVLFVLSGLIWLARIVPIQIEQARLARSFGTDVGERYRALSRAWLGWGLISTIPLVTAMWLMISKPSI
jgi:uncharacterized membrane protein